MSDDLSIPNPEYRGSRAGRYGTGRRVTSRGMDPDMRRMAMFAGGIAGALALLIGVSTLTGRRGAGVPVVTADTSPVKVKPQNPGGMKIDGAENDVFSGGTDTTDAKLAPPAETPDTKALRTSGMPPPASAPTATQAQAPAPPSAKPAIIAAAAIPVPQPAKPAPIVAQTPPKPAAAAPVAPTPAATPAGKAMVQLAAVGSEDDARGEWQRLSRKMPELLDGRQPTYTRTEKDGRTFWRVRTAGFADLTKARAFCEQVKAKGGGCSVAEF